MVLSPQDAAQAIRAGKLRGPATVSGRLDLTRFDGETLPSGLQCYDLDASESALKTLPADLKIESRLVLDNCRSLKSLPENLAADPSVCEIVPAFVHCRKIWPRGFWT